MHSVSGSEQQVHPVCLHGARYAAGPDECVEGTLTIEGGRIESLVSDKSSKCVDVDLSGYLLMPGLINAHDHLQYGLHPRLGHPTYKNYVDWGEDIHASCADEIAKYKRIPRDVRLWWGGIRNLLCGVTTVCHHDMLWPELLSPRFPVSVLREYGWAHSVALGGDLPAAKASQPAGSAFFIHACEGVDEFARDELNALEQAGLLDSDAVLIHGLAMDREGVALMQERGASLIVCPSSNNFLFHKLPDLNVLSVIQNLTLGSDSPLTATGDLLDEVRYAVDVCDVSSAQVYRMVTESAARVLRLKAREGTLQAGGAGDLIAFRDDGRCAAERLATLRMEDVELVVIRGEVRAASQSMFELLPAPICVGLEPLQVGDCIRWLRAPVRALLHETEVVLGTGAVRLGGRAICLAGTSAEQRNPVWAVA